VIDLYYEIIDAKMPKILTDMINTHTDLLLLLLFFDEEEDIIITE
jgi:hypothetical protein